jgi:hypothetical protein
MIVLVASENAGTGKTTLVTNLEVLSYLHWNSIIVDATQNHVSGQWVKTRNTIVSDGELPTTKRYRVLVVASTDPN